MMNYYLAEINMAKMKGVTINDPVTNEFADNLDRVNAHAFGNIQIVGKLQLHHLAIQAYFSDKAAVIILACRSIEAGHI